MPDDTLDRMRANPRADWTIAGVERACRAAGLRITAPRRGSHYKVRDPRSGPVLTIPAHRPIRPVYIRQLGELADRARQSREEK